MNHLFTFHVSRFGGATRGNVPRRPIKLTGRGMFFEENGRMFMGLPGEYVTVKPSTDPKRKADLDKVQFATKEQIFSHLADPTAWHSMTIIAKGNTFVHVVDGRGMSVA